MKHLIKITCAASAIFLGGSAIAQDFPTRNIENIYPWAPGATMAASQVIADAMGDELGVNISVVSTPGAAGTRAFETALSRAADGYTIFDGYVAPLVLQPMLGNVEWSYEDFTPLWSATSNSFAIATRADEERFTDLPSLIEYGKENPGDLRYSPGVANGLPHMVMARVLQSQDMVAQLVPYPEIDVAIRDLRGGILDFVVINPGVFEVNRDQVNVLAVLSELEEASATYDGAPRVADFDIDLGMTGLAPMGWNWWLVHPDTPEERVEVLRDAMGAALAREDVQQRLLDMGYVSLMHGPGEYEEVVGSAADELQGGIDAISWESEQLEALDN